MAWRIRERYSRRAGRLLALGLFEGERGEDTDEDADAEKEERGVPADAGQRPPIRG